MFRSYIKQHRISAFLLVVFGWTWAWDAVYIAMGWWDTLPVYINSFPRQWGLPIGAVIVVWASDSSLRKWLDRVLQWRLSPWVYLGALVFPVIVTNLQPVLAGLGGGSVSYAPPARLHLVFGFFLLNVFVFGGIEEFGWRGFLQPELQERLSVLTASLVVGVLWWAWHLPLFLGHPNFTPDLLFVIEYTLFVLGVAMILGALVNFTDGAVIPAILLHAAVNVGSILAGSGGILDGTLPISFIVGVGAWWLIAAVLVAMYGRSMTPQSAITPLE